MLAIGDALYMVNIVVIGMGYPSAPLRAGVGIPCAALLADVPGFQVIGVQRRSLRPCSGQALRSGWKIECLNSGKSPFEGDESGLEELISPTICLPHDESLRERRVRGSKRQDD